MSDTKRVGKSFDDAKKVAIMIHGRGVSAESIISLKDYLNLEDFAILAPQAPNNTWYPYSFMAPDHSNEPSLTQAIQIIDELVKEAKENGFTSDQIYFIGFSQGACLSLEYAARNANKYGGVIAFTGGLIGEVLDTEKYSGKFLGTPIFIGSSHKDMHVPLTRIQDSAEVFELMGAATKTLIFQDTNHTIREEEIDWVNNNILKK
ncbi:alpha/beta hydrolase [Belliella aquatica]|uniref:Phospholipase/carboxylesterase n=1 Tax=Belliella aquatica TaxID=1323734 RepID=A0ABQ1MTR3_9BACT|nr:dienelactone hydrolase family protein [Belliella aquatica]MCH7406169.1 dienelactone hydrolase family protein [Belliella aquatica]GGC44723.1 phospholipase/carboxylesterase [Belliella aquatica]